MARIGIIGGSGLGDALASGHRGHEVELDTPFGAPSGPIMIAQWDGLEIAIINRHGPGHVLSPTNVPYRANIYALKQLGCTHVIATCAVGSLQEHIAPKHLVVPDQVIDKTIHRPSTFFDKHLAVHVEMSSPFCSVLRKHLLSCASEVDTKVHPGGTYVCMEGPAFSTRAESDMHRKWGGDLIGMTAMPEARLAREAEMSYALLCLPSDYDCWRPSLGELDKHELLREIIGNLTDATKNAIKLIQAAVARFGEIADAPTPAHSALDLAVWSDRALIAPEAKEHFGILLAKHLK